MANVIPGTTLVQTGAEVQAAINKIIALSPGELEAIGIEVHNTEYWDSKIGYIPAPGAIIIYTDYKTVGDNPVPGIKIGSGNGYVQDLAFLGESESILLTEHLADEVRHITSSEREMWNNKLNITDSTEVVNETLIFNRN